MKIIKGKRTAAFALSAALMVGQAVAKPPEKTDPKMTPYYRGLTLKDKFPGYCCTESDCREVEAYKDDKGHWWAFISKEVFGEDKNTPDDWVQVPDELITPEQKGIARPIRAIACWYSGGRNYYESHVPYTLRCFDPPYEGF